MTTAAAWWRELATLARASSDDLRPGDAADAGGTPPLPWLVAAPDDFLAAAPAQPLAAPVGPSRPAGRDAELARLRASLPPAPLDPAWGQLEDATLDKLADADAPAAGLALQVAARLEGTPFTAGVLATWVGSVLRAGRDSGADQAWDDALAAAACAQRFGLAVVQEDLALLLAPAADRGFEAAEALLDALEALGDGRCVRAMEAALWAVGPRLPQHQAWRARHIVQRIRRGGRR